MLPFSAEEAMKLTNEKVEHLKAEEIDNVFGAIKSAIDKGEYDVKVNSDLYDETKDFLTKLGYYVHTYNCATTIAWNDIVE